MSSSDGMGASVVSELRSDSTMMRAPDSIAFDASAQISARRRPSAAPPPATSNRPRMTCVA
jgi:hypothetical protein